MANEYRITTYAAEALSSGASAARFSTVGVETLVSNSSNPTSARFSTFGLEVLLSVASASTGRRRTLVNQ